MKKKYVFVAVIILISSAINAQPAKLDSLLRLLPKAKQDSTSVQLYLAIGEQYERTDPAISKKYYNNAIALSKQINFKTGVFKSYSYYGNACFLLGEYDSLIVYGQKALSFARETNDSLNIGIGLMNIGMAYGFKSEFENAIQYFLSGLKAIEGKKYNTLEVQINDKLQVLYMQMTQYDKAISFGEKAVMQSRQLNMPVFLGQSLSNLAMSYSAKKMPEKAKPLLVEALAISKKLEDNNMESAILLNLADISMKSRDYETLKSYSERSLVLNRKLGSLPGVVTSLRALGIYYLQKKDIPKAKEYIQQSVAIAKENNYKAEYASGLMELSNISFASGDIEWGRENYQKSIDILTSMIDELLSDKSANLEKKYETEKKIIQIKQLEADKKVQQLSIRQKNILNYIFVAATIVFMVVSLLSYRNYMQKQKLQQQRINELETEKQLTATEAVLKGEEQERTRLAKDLHDGLGGMLSGIKYSMNSMKGNLIMTPENNQAFERSMDMLDSSIKEMRRVAHNMMPEALVKFGLDTALKDFCNDINQSGALKVNYQSIGLYEVDINQTTAITIYRIVQELINNTMKHAAATTAIVQVSKTGEKISVTVEDDGKGFDTEMLKTVKGIGWINIQSRVDFLKGALDVQSAPDKGTSVHIEFNT